MMYFHPWVVCVCVCNSSERRILQLYPRLISVKVASIIRRTWAKKVAFLSLVLLNSSSSCVIEFLVLCELPK